MTSEKKLRSWSSGRRDGQKLKKKVEVVVQVGRDGHDLRKKLEGEVVAQVGTDGQDLRKKVEVEHGRTRGPRTDMSCEKKVRVVVHVGMDNMSCEQKFKSWCKWAKDGRDLKEKSRSRSIGQG